MPDPQTTNLLLAIPSHGSDVDTWDVPLNVDFSAVDGFLGGIQTISLSSSPVTLTAPAGTPTPSGGPTQAQNAVLRFTGTLTTNVTVTLPLPGYYIVENALSITGNTLLLKAAGTGQVVGVPYGAPVHVYNDGTNVRFVNLPQVGSFQDYAGSTVPFWITACTKPPFLNCDGSSFSGATYPILAAILGGTTLPDLRGVARYTLNQGTGRLTAAGSGLDGNTNLSIKPTQSTTLTITNLPTFTPTGTVSGSATNPASLLYNGNLVQTIPSGSLGSGGFGWSNVPSIGPLVYSFSASLNINPIGSSAPFSAIGTGTVAGITLIRAG